MTDIVPRERLFRLLDSARQRPVIWVDGPGGAGKSSLVASYIDSRKLSCLWYQVDRGDQDIATLFHYLRMALGHARFAHPATLPSLTPEYQSRLETFSKRFFEKLFAALPTPSVVVLDDCHEVPDQSLFHLVLRSGLYEIPQGIQVIFISRNAPPASLVHFRSRSKLNLISWSDLRLTSAETEAIVRLRHTGGITREDAQRLHDKIQGWVAGLVLIIESGHAGQALNNPDLLPVKEVFNYFAGELFAGMEEATGCFLLKTAFLPEISVVSAQRLTGVAHSARILSELHEKNCFTERRFETEPVFRYHPLFREFLIDRALQVFSPEEISSIRHDAAMVLVDAGRTEHAVELLLEARCWDDAASLIVREAPAYITQGRSKTMQQWIGSLPEDIPEKMPYLLFWQGAFRLCENPAEAFGHFKHAYQIFTEQGDRVGQCLSWAAGADATLYCDFAYQDWIPAIEEYMRQNGAFPCPEIEARVVASLFNAMSLQKPDHPRLPEMEARAYAYFCQPDALDNNVRLQTGVYLVVFNLWSGEIAKARSIVTMLGELSRGSAVSDLTHITLKTTQALVDFFTGSFASCREAVFEAVRLSEETGISIWTCHVLGHGLAAALSGGNLTMADILLARIKENLDRAGVMDVGYYHFGVAWRARANGDLAGAYLNLDIAGSLLAKLDNLPCHAVIHASFAELCFRRGEKNAALERLAMAREVGRRMRSRVVEYMCLMLEAEMELERGRDAAGIELLGTALELGRTCGIVNVYWWQPDVMVGLCLKALQAGIEIEYVRGLIRSRGLVPPKPPVSLEEWPWAVKIYALGRFELYLNGKPACSSGKVQKKPLEMLKSLIALGGAESREGQVADLLWPESDGDTAKNSQKITLHRLREMLGNEKAVQIREGKLLLDQHQVWTDAWAFEAMLQSTSSGGRNDDALCQTEKALALYRGHFLDEDHDKPWASALRKRLRDRFKHAVSEQGSLWREKGDTARALACYQRGLEVDDLAGEMYQGLMECYLSAGHTEKVVSTYLCCREALASQGLAPPPNIVALYENALE